MNDTETLEKEKIEQTAEQQEPAHLDQNPGPAPEPCEEKGSCGCG